MAGMTPLPPHVLHSSTRLTHAQARSHLSSFLELAENNAAYRPDSTLTERGPQSASTGANPNLTLHHLKRILQGIEGKRIGGEDVTRIFGDEARAAGVVTQLKPGASKRKFEDQMPVGGEGAGVEDAKQQRRRKSGRWSMVDEHIEGFEKGPGIAVDSEGDDWQDKDEFDLAQREMTDAPELEEEKQPGLSLNQPEDDAEAEELLEIEIERTGEKQDPHKSPSKSYHVIDKDARKEAKKKRQKIEKIERQKRRKEH